MTQRMLGIGARCVRHSSGSSLVIAARKSKVQSRLKAFVFDLQRSVRRTANWAPVAKHSMRSPRVDFAASRRMPAGHNIDRVLGPQKLTNENDAVARSDVIDPLFQ